MTRKRILSALFSLLLFCALLSPISGECQEPANVVEIEYGGRLITVDMADLILMSDGRGGQTLQLLDPDKYEDPMEDSFRDGNPAHLAAPAGAQEISRREYEEEQRARRWFNVVEDLTLRQIDERALELVREFDEAKNAVPPMTGSAGALVLSYSTYIPRIICRPMYVTNVILQPGEMITGVHPGDPVRWTFAPGRSGSGNTEQMHILVKPLMADISTNLVITTDRRTYHLGLVSSATNHMPSVSFSYPDDSMRVWDSFIAERRREREARVSPASGFSISPEELHFDYEIRGKDSLRWKPVRVWDDGVKTYIQFRKGSMIRSVEAPVFIVYERRREVLVNYRVAEDMYIVDKIFDSGALIVGTGAAQERVVIRRLNRR